MCVCMCGLFLCDLNLTTSAVRAASGTFVREWLLCARVCPCLFLLSLVSLCCNKKFESRHSLSGSTENADSGAFIMHIGAVTFWPPMSPMKRFRLSLLSNFAFSLSLSCWHPSRQRCVFIVDMATKKGSTRWVDRSLSHHHHNMSNHGIELGPYRAKCQLRSADGFSVVTLCLS